MTNREPVPEGAWWAATGDDPWAAPQPAPAQQPDRGEPSPHPEAATQPVPPPATQPWQAPRTQPPYGQPPYAQPQYAQPPYAQPQYAQPYPPLPPVGPHLPGHAPYDGRPIPWAAAPLPAPAPAPVRRGLPAAAVVVLSVVLALVAGLVGGALGYGAARRSDDGTARALPAVSGRATPPRPPGSVAAIAADLLERVVSVQVSDGSGSGIIIRGDGYVLTNNHVIAEARSGGPVRVVFQDGSKAAATIVGADASYDLAVLRVRTGRTLPTATLGDSSAVVVGDPVIAVGSPLGLSGTVTTGIVSALDRPVTAGSSGGGGCGSSSSSYYSAIQTDAAINPGNSGGPLVDAQGDVIGINSAISSLGGSEGQQTGSIGLGFAIPSNQAKRIAEEIIRNGVAVHPVLGVAIDCAYTGEGARLQSVTAGAARSAGLRAGDVVTAVDGRQVADSQELIVAIRAHVPGETVTVAYRRGSGTGSARVVLGRQRGS
ncbi:putative serine protease PepD [Motilibacter rhizosphaerae]|uniref:Putative serine protease PepD n=1 Tax=Motilibacter rhizosphaerae TaxID=598652 RepID=A0A4Q7NPK8_9ACTN|nr:trypsin-like peptidase domain-containing protein [Motilibacter rhizosphaerae]RZS87244.1 putative serine protease PepD [Motilibacter rhizosphaerae]